MKIILFKFFLKNSIGIQFSLKNLDSNFHIFSKKNYTSIEANNGNTDISQLLKTEDKIFYGSVETNGISTCNFESAKNSNPMMK